MGHWAKVDENNIVVQVIVAEKDVIDSGLFGDPSTFIQTSYNTYGGVHYIPNSRTPSEDQSKALRKNYAGIGFTYDPNLDAFYEPQPFPSWTLNTNTCQWDSPIPHPQDGKSYMWDENTTSWIEVTE